MAVGWGIIGTGVHADEYIAPAMNATRGARLVAVTDRDLDSASAFAGKHGALRVHGTYSELLADPEVQAVYIATPNNLHAEHTLQAARAGRHVLVEKPMALTASDCRGMVAACREAGVKLGVDFQQRNHPAIAEARRLVASGRLGEPVLVKIERARAAGDPFGTAWRKDPAVAGGNAIMASGVHILDLLCYILGSKVTEVSAMVDSPYPDKSMDDTTVALLKFESGAFGVMSCSVRQFKPTNDLVLTGTRGTMIGIGVVPLPTEMGTLAPPTLTLFEKGQVSRMEYQYKSCFAEVIADFVGAIEEDRDPIASGLDGLHVVEITEAIFQSARSGERVFLLRPQHVM